MQKADTKFVRALLKLKPTNEGGRQSAILSGYRPNHVFEYVDGQVLSAFIGEIQFDDSPPIKPGTEREVVIRFLFVPKLDEYLTVGRQWWIHEGSRLIGEATVTEILA